AAGCSDAPAAAARNERAPSAPDAAYILTEEPENALQVAEARLLSKNDEEITVIGLIGGGEPFVDGLAAFTIVDCSAKASSESHEEGCTDACCNPGLKPANVAMVKIVN